MNETRVYEIGQHRIVIASRDSVGLPTPYSILIANCIPELSGHTVIDVGTGSGILGIIARLQGAARVYVLDTNVEAISVALENAERNAVQDEFAPLPTGATIIPLPPGETVDMVLCNPAQLPLPEPDRPDSAFYAGQDGRRMIEEVIRAAPGRLSPSGRLLMTHNSMTDFPESVRLMKSLGLEPRVLAERTFEFRPFVDRAWLDELGGTARQLYTVRDGRPYETLYVVEARLRGHADSEQG
jgi:release factor glutamine methyltransferase